MLDSNQKEATAELRRDCVRHQPVRRYVCSMCVVWNGWISLGAKRIEREYDRRGLVGKGSKR